MLTAYAIGAGEAIIYTRSRYIQTVKRLEQAIAQVKAIKLLGEDILESGYSLNVHIRKGPGAYVCGEETALIASIEGKRGMPRPKPPYPAEKGLFGYPTLVHNVETIAQLPGIVAHGPVWYRSAGTETSSGTKLYSLSGKFKQQGVLELPFGYTLEQLIYQNAGGTKKGKAVKAVLAGGPLGKFVMPDQFQLSMDYSSYREQNLMLGSGSLILLDEKSCPINLLAHILEFLKQESCGKCIPCREGSKRMSDVLNAVTRKSTGEHSHAALHRFKGLTQLEQLAQVIQETSLCGLGKGAPRPLLSALDCFRDEFEEHVFNRVCPAGVCQDLRTFSIDADACTGCYLCFSKCPEQAIIGSPRQTHVIVADRCTGCGLCAEVCMFNAVKVQ